MLSRLLEKKVLTISNTQFSSDTQSCLRSHNVLGLSFMQHSKPHPLWISIFPCLSFVGGHYITNPTHSKVPNKNASRFFITKGETTPLTTWPTKRPPPVSTSPFHRHLLKPRSPRWFPSGRYRNASRESSLLLWSDRGHIEVTNGCFPYM